MVKSDKAKKKVNGSPSNVSSDGARNATNGSAKISKNDIAEKLKEHHQNFAKATKEAFEKFSQQAKDAKVDHKAIIESHQKNLRVLNEANKKAAEVMKSIATLQSQFVKQTFEDFNSMMRGMMTQKAGEPTDFTAHVETMKHSFERAIDHAQHVGSIISQSGKEIHASMQTRMEEGKEELKAHLEKHRTRH